MIKQTILYVLPLLALAFGVSSWLSAKKISKGIKELSEAFDRKLIAKGINPKEVIAFKNHSRK